MSSSAYWQLLASRPRANCRQDSPVGNVISHRAAIVAVGLNKSVIDQQRWLLYAGKDAR
jgi:hypothetical protein